MRILGSSESLAGYFNKMVTKEQSLLFDMSKAFE